MSEKVPLISRGQPITAEYLNSLARAVNAGQIVLPGAAAGGASISSPTGSGSSPSSDVRTWTITSVTEVGGIATSLTMTDGAGSIWTINNVDDLCNLCGGGGGGGVTNYVMAVTVEEINLWTMTATVAVGCSPPPGAYLTYTLKLSLGRRVYWCQNGEHDAAVWAGMYVKLLNGGTPVPDWNFTQSPTRTLFTWPNVPGSNPNPATCTLATYATMSQFRALTTSNPDCPQSFRTGLPPFDTVQLLASDNTTIIFDLDVSGTACENVSSILSSTTTTAEGHAWVACGDYYRLTTSPDCRPAVYRIDAAQSVTDTFRKSWILAAP